MDGSCDGSSDGAARAINRPSLFLWRDGHVCQHCRGRSKDKILNVHHLESRITGGDAPNGAHGRHELHTATFDANGEDVTLPALELTTRLILENQQKNSL